MTHAPGRALALAIAALVGLATLAPTALADDQDASTEALARQLFNDGVKAYRAKDYEKARGLFARAHGLVPTHSLVLFNLASSQARVGALVEASRSFQKFLANAEPGQMTSYRTRAETWLTELAGRIPSVRIRVIGLDESDTLALNGQTLPHAVLGEAVPVDPGDFTLTVERAGKTLATRTMTLAEGKGTTNVDLTVPIVKTAPAVKKTPAIVGPTPPERDASGGTLSSPWFWVATTAVLGAAGGAGYYFLVYKPDNELDPTAGNLGTGLEF